MKKRTITTWLFVAGLLMSFVTVAQRPSPGNQSPSGEITGQVFDKNTSAPLEYANIALYSIKDSTLVTGAIADSTGHFVLDGVRFGKFYMAIDFIGYKKEIIDEITMRPPEMKKSVGKVYLRPAAKALQGVDITAEKNRVEYKIDKKIINVSKDLNAAGGTAVDVLRNTPSVEVDIEGNVSLRGSENFKVYIDGKPTVLEGNDLLKQLPAGSIDQIEIITNPSVKYDPDGTGGIINVKMKEEHRGGFNGIVNGSLSSNESYSGDFLLNYKTGKFNFFAGADVRDYKSDGNGMINRQTFFLDTTFFYDSDKSRTRKHNGYSFETGMDYHINNRNTISLSGKAGHYGFGFDFDSDIHSYTAPFSDLSEEYLVNKNVFDRSGDYYRGDINYQLQFDDNGHNLQALAYFSYGDDEQLETQEDFMADSDYEINDEFPEKIKATEEETDNNARFKIDYVRPLPGKGKFEAGVQSRLKSEESQYAFNYFDYAQQLWVDADSLSSDFTYHRNISSAYATYSGSIGIVGLKAGFRGEYTDREIAKSSGESYVVDRWDWFPSLHLSLDLDKENKVQASYSKRIRRPRGWFLDPVISYRDKYNVRRGNPELEPEYTHSFELSYMKRFDGGFATLEGYYRNTINEFTRLSQLYTQEIMLMTFENLNSEKNMGAELMINTDITEWWRMNVSGNFYRYQVSDEIEGEDISRESNNWSLRFNSDFDLFANSRLQLRGYYRGPSVTIQGERSSFFYTSIAYRQDFMDKKLNLTLSMRDVFGTMKREYITDQPDYYVKQKFERESQILRLSVSYKINDYKRKRRGENGGPEMEMEGSEGGF